MTAATTTLVWPEGPFRAYAVLDAAGCDELLDRLYAEEDAPEFECLYQGEIDDDMAYVAPYLAELPPGSTFANWVLDGFGEHWSICVVVPEDVDLATLRRHLRQFNIVYGADGKPAYFRWYDPRVLRVYAPKCEGDQLDRLFGPIERFVMEGVEPGEVTVLARDDGQLLATTHGSAAPNAG